MESTLIEVWRYAQVVLGVGLVIFVHECGHFIAARLSGVRVEVFSLGFGPKIMGWRRGSTLYQWALFPLGGYVKMAGEESHGAKPEPDELGAKSVGQRFFIYSGGVLANVAFGLVVFPFILAVGVPFAEPLLGPSSPGSPAWHANVKPGSRVLSVNGNEVFGFIHIPNEVALGSPEQTLLEVVEPGAREPRTVHLTPVYSTEMGAYSIGVRPAADPKGTISVDELSPASEAGLKTGDRLVAVEGAIPGLALEDQLFMAMRDGEPLGATFERNGETIQAHLTARESPEVQDRVLGVAALFNRVLDIRDTPLAKRLGLEKDDRVLSLNGKPIFREYDLLESWIDAQGAAVLRVERAGRTIDVTLPNLDSSERLAAFDDLAIVPDADGARIAVAPRTSADQAGLRDGDRILRIDGAEISSFKDISGAGREAKEGRALHISAERRASDGTPQFLEFEVAPRVRHPMTYGVSLQSAQYIYQTKGPVQAVRVGVASSWKFIEESWLTLKRILLGQVSGNNIGGIITIGVVSHSWASVGITKLLFFLCMLSMNLAFLNVLPIPVLDGGHLFFLLIEKIKGSPVSERVLGYSQMVGIVLILSLMVYVTFNDVMKWIVH